MKDTALIAGIAFLCITIIAVAGLATGHNTAVITGATSTIAGIAAGFGAYKAAKAKHTEWTNEKSEKEVKKDE